MASQYNATYRSWYRTYRNMIRAGYTQKLDDDIEWLMEATTGFVSQADGGGSYTQDVGELRDRLDAALAVKTGQGTPGRKRERSYSTDWSALSTDW